MTRCVQTEDFLDVITGNHSNFEEYCKNFPLTADFLQNSKREFHLVDYDIESDSASDNENMGKVFLSGPRASDNEMNTLFCSLMSEERLFLKRKYFDDAENNIISEISQRKRLKEQDDIKHCQPRICKLDPANRRKSKIPKKLDTQVAVFNLQDFGGSPISKEHDTNMFNNEFNTQEDTFSQNDKLLNFPQNCLLCDSPFSGPTALATHVFEIHGIDMAEIISSGTTGGESCTEKRKKLPNLVKISDLKRNDSLDESQSPDCHTEEPPTLFPTFVCPTCPAIFTDKSELGSHIRVKHTKQAALLCGLCMHQCSSVINLKVHLESCSQKYRTEARYICQICGYGEDNIKSLENHILVHDFLLEACKKHLKMFDPEDYIDINENLSVESQSFNLVCEECGLNSFESFKQFSLHRRAEHSIYHCDLCSKFYGRNSHLWKHVNRLHKGHPSITCQLCSKTSASKYHLTQHFNKIHLTKQRMIQTSDKGVKLEIYGNNLNKGHGDLQLPQEEVLEAPKEIDSSHDLYTNIITNYTPPLNEGDFKCPKCCKAFHKKVLLKKHKKNCRPKMQKDLLTRCKTCSRIFKDRQSLAKHLVNYHSEYICEICNQKVQSKCEIVSHIRFQHPTCHLFCKLCKNILRSLEDMKEHLRNHLDSYICQFCGDSLPSKIKLKMHILSLHRKILSLSCGICLKLFENQQVLKDHVTLVHRNQLTPLTSCPVCGKNYGSKWKTYDHLNKSHGKIFKACKTCLEVFNNDAQLQAHCDVTSHGNSTNVSASLLRNSIMAQITSAFSNVASNSATNDDEDDDNEEQEDSDEENEDNSEESSDEYETDLINENKLYMQQFSKMSMLEKRLIGKKVNEESNDSSKANKSLQTDLKKEVIDSERAHSPNNPQVNSSKRTVYVNSNDPSRCEICLKTWPAKKHLWQHYIRCHKTVAATVCGICLKTNESYESLQEHLKENHPTLLHGQGFGSNFICKICGRYHNASSKLRLHMVIHESFNWKLLEETDKPTDQQPTSNGMQKPKTEDENTINYESLIEQVECSSQSDNDEYDKEQKNDLNDEDDSSSDADSDESALSENNLLKNINNENAGCSSEDSSSSVSDCSRSENEDDSQPGTFQNQHSNSASVDSILNSNLFKQKPEELDSAIKSISYECMESADLNIVDDYCDLQGGCLNENEIESAVGSIL